VCNGLGVAPQRIREVIGVSKAYCTRVGSGPFPTELEDETGEKLRKVGNEFGATTGRPRRCGWMDLVALHYACMLNGCTQIVMTKADVLDAFDELQVCTSYRIDGKETAEIPFQMMHSKIEPVYQAFKGWNTDSSVIKEATALPTEMTDYVAFLNKALPCEVRYISNGPGRDQIIKI
jgi:adenylosuccinate synthase